MLSALPVAMSILTFHTVGSGDPGPINSRQTVSAVHLSVLPMQLTLSSVDSCRYTGPS